MKLLAALVGGAVLAVMPIVIIALVASFVGFVAGVVALWFTFKQGRKLEAFAAELSTVVEQVNVPPSGN